MPFSSLVILLGIMTACVLGTMLVEHWGRVREMCDVDDASEYRLLVSLSNDRPTTTRTGALSDPPTAPVVAIEPGGSTGDPTLRIGGGPLADRLIAGLFASYASMRFQEANRVSAWVTAAARPPSEAGPEFRPGADLRGRPRAVGRLLSCAEQGRSWVTINSKVDIGRGLRLRPPTCPVLAGITPLWWATRSATSRLDAVEVEQAYEALCQLSAAWCSTTAEPDLRPLLDALSTAIGSASGLVVLVEEPRAQEPPSVSAPARGMVGV